MRKILLAIAAMVLATACADATTDVDLSSQYQLSLTDLGITLPVAADAPAVDATASITLGPQFVLQLKKIAEHDYVHDPDFTCQFNSIKLTSDGTLAGLGAFSVTLVNGAVSVPVLDLAITEAQQAGDSVTFSVPEVDANTIKSLIVNPATQIVVHVEGDPSLLDFTTLTLDVDVHFELSAVISVAKN